MPGTYYINHFLIIIVQITALLISTGSFLNTSCCHLKNVTLGQITLSNPADLYKDTSFRERFAISQGCGSRARLMMKECTFNLAIENLLNAGIFGIGLREVVPKGICVT